jgi:NADH:ubiquinone oxidoreductase subunit K
MIADLGQTFTISLGFAVLLFITGLYCILLTTNMIRMFIGIEILMKAVTLLIIAAGYAAGRTGLAQSVVITFIFVETVIMVVAGGIVLGLFRHTKTLDLKKLRNLKG